MRNHAYINIEIAVHTDSRGDDTYNLILSQKRARKAKEFLTQMGIDNQRISAKGYGERQLLNQCKNNVKCSRKQHEENRRTEIIISSLKQQ